MALHIKHSYLIIFVNDPVFNIYNKIHNLGVNTEIPTTIRIPSANTVTTLSSCTQLCVTTRDSLNHCFPVGQNKLN